MLMLFMAKKNIVCLGLSLKTNSKNSSEIVGIRNVTPLKVKKRLDRLIYICFCHLYARLLSLDVHINTLYTRITFFASSSYGFYSNSFAMCRGNRE